MKRNLQRILHIWLAALILTISGLPLSSPQDVFQFANGTWVENIAVRSSGNIIVTLKSPAAEVWEIDPSSSTANLIYQFPNATSAFGIAEVKPDVFAVVVGTVAGEEGLGVPGTFSVWSVDVSEQTPKAEQIVAIPEAGWLNGATLPPGQYSSLGASALLLADSSYGLIWRLDLVTGTYSVWADDPAFKPNSTAPLSLGVNGIHSYGADVYFTNTFALNPLGLIHVSIDGSPAGPAQPLADPALSGYGLDDFAIDLYGNIYVATGASNVLLEVTPNGSVTVVAGSIDDPLLAGDTSAAFGRTDSDQNIVYVSTNGGATSTTTVPEGGKVVAVDTNGW